SRANQEQRRIFLVLPARLAVELNEETWPVGFVFLPHSLTEKPARSELHRAPLQLGPKAEAGACSSFPLFERRGKYAHDDGGRFRHRHRADDRGDIHQQIVLLHLAAGRPGNARHPRSQRQGKMAPRQASGGRFDALDDVGLTAISALVNPIVQRDAGRQPVVVIDVRARLGQVLMISPFRVFEIIANLFDLLTTPRDDMVPILCQGRSGARSRGNEAQKQQSPCNADPSCYGFQRHRLDPSVTDSNWGVSTRPENRQITMYWQY